MKSGGRAADTTFALGTAGILGRRSLLFCASAPTCRENCAGNQKRKLRNNRPATTCHELVDGKARQMRAVRAENFHFARSPNRCPRQSLGYVGTLTIKMRPPWWSCLKAHGALLMA